MSRQRSLTSNLNVAILRSGESHFMLFVRFTTKVLGFFRAQGLESIACKTIKNRRDEFGFVLGPAALSMTDPL
jgi:hypothetical protein